MLEQAKEPELNDDTVTEAISAVPEQVMLPVIEYKTVYDQQHECWSAGDSDTDGVLQGNTGGNEKCIVL